MKALNMLDPLQVDHSSLIPPHSSLFTTDRQRRSVPLNAASSLRRRPANHVNVNPASAEVISSLISTLSAISPPSYQHSDHLPENFCHSTPSSPQNADFAFITSPAGDVEGRDSKQSAGIRFDMDNERGETPSRRTGKQTSPRKTSRSEWRRSSFDSDNGWDDAHSIGHLSIEPPPRLSVISTVSSESAGRKSNRSFRSLNFRSSKEGIFEGTKTFGEVGIVVLSPNDDGAERGGANTDDISPTAPLSSIISEQTLGGGLLAAAQENVCQASTPHSETDNERTSLASGGLGLCSLGAVASPRIVPARDSSLRRSYKDRPSHQSHKSYRFDLSDYQESTHPSVEASQDGQLSISRPKNGVTEDEVSRRIRELKDQKRVRDRFGAVDKRDSTGTPEISEHCRTPTPDPAPSVLLSGTTQDLRDIQISECEESGKKEATESSAPSPAIVQRISRNSSSRVSSVTNKCTSVKSCSPGNPNCEHQRESAVPPKRSNSRMLKRLSRPPSPLSSERHRRTLSSVITDERPISTNSVDKAVDGYISSSRLSQKVFHPQTGRTISFSEVGDPNGSAVLCCVGMGLTRYITAFYDELASTLKLRLITPDRPGVGGSESHPDGSETPLGWPDDVLIICQHLKLTKFSILAHSAGAIYALATALRMPQHIRGRIHLLAPWIPPSQMAAFGSQQEALPVSALPYSQRFLRSLPTPFLRAANSSFLSTTSTSITTRLSKTPRHPKHKSIALEISSRTNDRIRVSSSAPDYGCTEASISKAALLLDGSRTNRQGMDPSTSGTARGETESIYDSLLTEAIWNAATMGANPAVDLLVCLERRQSIGFRYVDITRSVVIHHGSKDTRVPVENVKWLGKTMRRCEVRTLDGEGHGLMASAAVIGGVLMEMAKEWEDWMRLVQGKSSSARRIVRT